MFGDDNKNKLKLLSSMKITIVDSEGQNNGLHLMIYEKISNEYFDKLKISSIQNINYLYQKSLNNKEESSQGLLNTLWMEEITTSRPSVIILYYYIKEGSTKEEEEVKISNIIDDILKYDQNVYIYLFIMIPPQEFDIYQHLKDDDKSPNAIRKKLDRDFIYIFTSNDITKTIELSKLCNSLIICSRNYYKKLKEEVRIKKNESMNLEEFIKYDIMLGILSTIKSKKKEICLSKHLKEAYDIICSKSFDHKKYLYGNPENSKLNFFEIRAIADWLLFKIMNLNLKITENMYPTNKKKNQIITKQKNLDAQSKLDIFYNHIKIFSSFDYGDKDKEGDPFYFFRDFWTYKRYINLIEFFEKNINELLSEKNYIHKIGIINFNISYIFMKMIKFYQKYFKDIDMTKVIINGNEIPINSISIKPNIYYAKPPNFVYEDPNLKEKVELGYNDEIYLKKFIINNDLTLDKMLVRLRNTLIPNILLFYYKTSKLQKGYDISKIVNDSVILNKQNIVKDNDMRGLEFYLNSLSLNSNKEGIDEKDIYKFSNINDIMFDLYINFDLSQNCKKFPKIYVNFLNKFTQCLIYQMENVNKNENFNNIKKTALFKSLSILTSCKILTEKEQEIFNTLLNDESFIPSYEKKEKEDNIVLEINNNVVINKDEDEDIEKNLDKTYAKKDDILINIDLPKNVTNEERSFSFEYNVKDIEKSQERKILDLVEYEFKLTTKLENMKLKFDNIKIFFICVNEESNDVRNKNQKEVIIKEFTQDELLNNELTKDTPLILQHKIFLKYKKGKIYASKIMATLSQKNNIIYLFDIPSEIKKVIFIKDSSKNVLNFKYRKSYKIGTNQYAPFDLFVSKEKIDNVKIEDFKIEFETIPTFDSKELSSITPLKKIEEETKSPKEDQSSEPFEAFSSKSLKFGEQRSSIKEKKKIKDINETNFESMKRSSCGPEIMKKLSNRIPSSSIDFGKINEKENYEIEKKYSGKFLPQVNPRSSKTLLKINPNKNQNNLIPSPEFYIYNTTNNSLDKYTNKMEIKYNNFESLLDQGRNKYSTLMKFLYEGSYRIKFSIIYYIRHKEIEDYIEFKEDSILDFTIIKPIICSNEIITNNYMRIENKRYGMKSNEDEEEKENRIYLTDNKIGMNFILTNRIEEDIHIKDIIIEAKDDQAIKYINSYLNDLIHSYDLEKQEKNEMLIIQKSSNYNIPFETEFSNSFNGSIGKITIVWKTKSMEVYEDGKFNLLNKDEFSFPNVDVRPLDLEYNYKTQMNESNEIILDIEIKNKSDKSRQILVTIGNRDEKDDNSFIIIGISKQTYIIRENETININYILIPNGRGEYNFPYVRISERDPSIKEKIFNNFYFSEKIAII